MHERHVMSQRIKLGRASGLALKEEGNKEKARKPLRRAGGEGKKQNIFLSFK